MRIPAPSCGLVRHIRSAVSTVTFQELSGSLGDLGTFLPLVVALAASIQLDLGTTLLFTGLYNILSGIGFRIPMCVQPMKTIAAVALASPGLKLPEVMSAGMFVSGTMLLLGLTGAMNLFNAAVPTSIVRGIQLAVGLSLAKKGVAQAFMAGPHKWRPWLGTEGLLLGLLAAAFLLVMTVPAVQQQQQQQQHEEDEQREQQRKQWALHDCEHQSDQQQGQIEQEGLLAGHQQQQEQQISLAQYQHLHHQQHPQHAVACIHANTSAPEAAAAVAGAHSCSTSSCTTSSSIPSALLVVVIGMILTPIANPSVLSGLSLGPSIPQFSIPTFEEFKSGVLKAGFAQLPLTSLNSVVAVTQLAHQLFPARVAQDGWRWQPGAVAASVGAMNLLGCWWGAFPCCHGSGGLAAQYKFGARSGAAPVILGAIKISLALVFGSSLLQLLQQFPSPLLGAMLFMSGIELAASARKEADARGYSFMLLTAASIIGLGDTALGFLVGMGGHAAVVLYEWCCSRVGQALAERQHAMQQPGV